MSVLVARLHLLVATGLVTLALVATLVADRVDVRTYDLLYLAVVLGAAAQALWAARQRTDTQRSVALLMAVGIALGGLGDVVWTVDSWRRVVPDASMADPFYLAGLAAMCVALLGAVTARGSRPDADAVIDVITIGVVSVMLMWHTALATIATGEAQDLTERAVLMSYPVLDAILIALVVRRFWSGSAHSWIGPGFALGLGCWLASDLAYLYSFVPGGGDRWMSLGWMVGAVLMAHALARGEHDAAPLRAATGTRGRLVVAIVPLAVPTALLLIDSDAAENEWPVILAGTAVLVALALVRTSRMLRSEEAARAEMVRARDEALAASRAKSEFLATMSHEVRTPLNGVLGLTTLLLGSELDDRQRRYAEESFRAGESLLRIINDLLDFSKIEAGHLRLEEVELDVRQLLQDLTGMAGAPRAPGGVTLSVEIDPLLPSGLLGDPHRLRQVLLNLTANALKFTARGEIAVVARVVDQNEDGVDLRLEVRDTGIGIAADHLERMFEPFVQADSSTTREYGGTGLGLAISRRLVEAMGGRLHASSTLGTGSTFWFELSLRRVLPDPVAAAEQVRAEVVGGEAPGAPSRRRRALVVHPDEIDQIIAEGIVRHLGFEVQVVADASRALAALAGDPIELLVVDAGTEGLADLVGTQVGVPVIAVADGGAARDRAEALGLAVVVDAPMDVTALRAAVDQVLGGAVPAV